MSKGGILSTDYDKILKFEEMGAFPKYMRGEAIEKADVVIDCTPQGNKLKDKYYKHFTGQGKLFLAQGSETGFGTIFAKGINERALSDQEFVQIASCNTHNIAILIKLFATIGYHDYSRFVCIRRATDTSQNHSSGGVEVSPHVSSEFGTHHGLDVSRLYSTLDDKVNVFTSALKVPTQYMHTIHFYIRTVWAPERDGITKDTVVTALKDNENVTITNKTTSNRVFSFGREHGHYGRLLTQTVVSVPSVSVSELEGGGHEITGFCFTPQDGNSLLSSVAATLWHLNDRDWPAVRKKMQCLKDLTFQEV